MITWESEFLVLNERTKQDIIYLILAVLIVVGVYMASRIYNMYNKPLEYNIARNGRIINYEQDVAYVVREEEVVDTSEYDKDMQIVTSDNSRIAKGGTIASFAVEENEELRNKIKEVDVEIQELIKDVQPEPTQELRSVEKSLENEIYNYVQEKNYYEDITNKKKYLDELLERKVKIIAGSSTKGSDLNKLVKERESLEKEINQNKIRVTADKAGLVSYRVDGYESKLSPNSFSNITVDMLENIKVSTDQIIPIDTKQVKIINNFYTYLIVVSKSEESKKIMLNDVIKYTINNNLNTLNKGVVDYIINENDTRYIFLKTTENVEKLAQYRKLNISIVWWNYQGMKISNNSIFEDVIKDDEGNEIAKLSAINLQTNTGYTRKVWVKVEKQAGGYSIVDNYTDAELEELGVPEDKVEDRSKLNLYDKVLVMT